MTDRERDLWLMVIGAALASPKFRDYLESLPIYSTVGALLDALTAIASADGARVRKWFAETYVPRAVHCDDADAMRRINDGKIIDEIVVQIRRLAAVRETNRSVRQLSMRPSASPELIVDILRGEADRVERVLAIGKS